VHVDRDVARPRVGAGIPQGLLRGAEDELFHLRGQAQARLHVDRDVDPARGQRRCQVGQRSREPLLLQCGRVDLEQQRAQLADGAAGARGAVLERLAQLRLVVLSLERRRHAEPVPGQLLHDAVVKPRRDRPALVRRCVDRVLERQLPLPLRPADAVRHPVREGQLEQRQDEQRDDRDGGEQPRDAAAVTGDGARAQVLLVEHGRAVLGAEA
jgi:hypothetical protein